MSSASRVRRLKIAKQAYFETGTAILPDAIYDTEETILQREAPDHPFLEEVGERPTGTYDIALPYPMPSLRKVKPDESSFNSFVRKSSEKSGGRQWVCSDKLDGISALWVLPEKKLYLRGDGAIGTDVSRFIPFVYGLVHSNSDSYGNHHIAIRGELLIRKEDAPHDVTNLRSFVNGMFHRKTIDDHGARCIPPVQFIAYQVIQPSIPNRAEQFKWLLNEGFQVPTFSIVSDLNAHDMSAYWNSRRQQSPYELDGIVVATLAVHSSTEFGDKYPDDTVAFKMPLPEQSAQTTVKKVHWMASRQSVWIPRVEIEPVIIGGARIQFVTGHNARFIDDEGIGPGARIIIRRSGDVIPIIDYVGNGCINGPEMPPKDTWEWHGVHAKMIGDSIVSVDVLTRKLLHYMRSIGVQHCGEASAKCLVEHGIIGAKEIGPWKLEEAKEWFGNIAGEKLWNAIRKAEANASEQSIWQGCPHIPPGIGPARWATLFQEYPDYSKWPGLHATKPSGWNDALWLAFQQSLPKAYTWRTEDLKRIGNTSSAAQICGGGGGGTTAVANGKTVVFTGFRDRELETRLIAAGWKIGTSVSGSTYAVVVDDSVSEPSSHTSSKVRLAVTKNIPVMTRAQFVSRNFS